MGGVGSGRSPERPEQEESYTVTLPQSLVARLKREVILLQKFKALQQANRLLRARGPDDKTKAKFRELRAKNRELRRQIKFLMMQNGLLVRSIGSVRDRLAQLAASKAATGEMLVHWSKRPDADPEKVRVWREKIAQPGEKKRSHHGAVERRGRRKAVSPKDREREGAGPVARVPAQAGE